MTIAIAGVFIGLAAHVGFAGWEFPPADTTLLVAVCLGGLMAYAGWAASPVRRITGAGRDGE